MKNGITPNLTSDSDSTSLIYPKPDKTSFLLDGNAENWRYSIFGTSKTALHQKFLEKARKYYSQIKTRTSLFEKMINCTENKNTKYLFFFKYGTIMGWDRSHPIPVGWDGTGTETSGMGGTGTEKNIFSWDGMGLGHKFKKNVGWDGTRPIPFTSLV